MTLRTALEASHAQTEQLKLPGAPLAQFEAVQHFQRERLAISYADLSAQPRYADACHFFLEELYGGEDVRARDRQVENAIPIMEKTLPGRMQEALADAFRLQALSLAGDLALAEGMAEQDWDQLSPEQYTQLYPRFPRVAREEQIALIYRLALELDRAVQLPLVLGLIVAMRGPARAAGFRALQSFLERGLRSFRKMRGADTFAETIRDRELRIMAQLYAGDSDPFRI